MFKINHLSIKYVSSQQYFSNSVIYRTLQIDTNCLCAKLRINNTSYLFCELVLKKDRFEGVGRGVVILLSEYKYFIINNYSLHHYIIL